MNDEGEQSLQAHVAPGRHQVAGVRDALNVESSEAPLAGQLLDDRHRPSRAFGVEDQSSTPRRDEHRREARRRNHDHGADRHERNAHRRPPTPSPGGGVAQDGEHSHGRGPHRQDAERVHEPQRRNQDEAGRETPGHTPDGVDRQDRAHASPHASGIDDEPQSGRKRSAQEDCRHQNQAGGGECEAGAHGGELAARRREDEMANLRLPAGQPAAQRADGKQAGQTGSANQKTEASPAIPHPIRARGVQAAPGNQTGQIRRQHHGEGEASCARELHDCLRPDHLVPEREATGERIHAERGSGLRWGRRARK